MKLSIVSYNAVATWKWDTSTEPHKLYHHARPVVEADAGYDDYNDDDDEEDEDDVCGICRLAYEACCPECKVPGDDCPLSESYVIYAFLTSSLGRMSAYLSYALPAQMDRYRIFEAAMSNGPTALGWVLNRFIKLTLVTADRKSDKLPTTTTGAPVATLPSGPIPPGITSEGHIEPNADGQEGSDEDVMEVDDDVAD